MTNIAKTNVAKTKQAVHYGMDAGSIPNGNFSWVSSNLPEKDSNDLDALASHITDNLRAGRHVTLGLECPLFWPCPDEVARLGTRRLGEGRRSWSAGAGATITPTGCQSLAWLLRSVAAKTPAAQGTTCWDDFEADKASIFLWEAFASDKPETVPHDIDARLVLLTFLRWRQNPALLEQITADRTINLAAALLLWSGVGKDSTAIRSSCLALKVTYPTPLPKWDNFREQIRAETAKLLNRSGGEMTDCDGREEGASLL